MPSPPGVSGFDGAIALSGFEAAVVAGFAYPLGLESKSPLPCDPPNKLDELADAVTAEDALEVSGFFGYDKNPSEDVPSAGFGCVLKIPPAAPG